MLRGERKAQQQGWVMGAGTNTGAALVSRRAPPVFLSTHPSGAVRPLSPGYVAKPRPGHRALPRRAVVHQRQLTSLRWRVRAPVGTIDGSIDGIEIPGTRVRSYTQARSWRNMRPPRLVDAGAVRGGLRSAGVRGRRAVTLVVVVDLAPRPPAHPAPGLGRPRVRGTDRVERPVRGQLASSTCLPVMSTAGSREISSTRSWGDLVKTK